MGNLAYSKCFNPRLSKTTQDTPLFSLRGLRFAAKVVRVYDGDTIHCVFKFNGSFQRFKIRMMGYDSPEMKPKHKDADGVDRTPESLSAEKEAATRAKMALSEKILHRIVELQITEADDKYGRLLAIVHFPCFPCGSLNVNEWMICQGHGYEYNGKAKVQFDRQPLETEFVPEE